MNHIEEGHYRNVLKKKTLIHIKFHPNDTMLLSKLIDGTPGVKDINGDPKILHGLWVRLTKEYNRNAMQYRNAASLRRKFKIMRDTIKKRAKDKFRTRQVGNQPDFDHLPSSFTVEGSSGAVRGDDFCGSSSGINYGNSFISDPTFPPLDQQRINFANVSFLDAQMSNNERQSNQNANCLDENFDPFGDEGKESYYEEDSVKESDHGAADEQIDIAALQRTLLETEIACYKEAHQKFLFKMKKYHDLKMYELKLGIENMKSKHKLEMQYLKLKMQQCRNVKSGGRGYQCETLFDRSNEERRNMESTLENGEWNINAVTDDVCFQDDVVFNNAHNGLVGN